MSEKLGTLEFCTALNGENLDQVRIVLKRFVRTVREERNDAFSNLKNSSGSEDDYSSDNLSYSSSEEEDQIRPRKRSKLEESWKTDTKAYNVPFVGTSTHKGSTGVVKRECWPTGFLEAYLQQSPQAMELLGKDFKKNLASVNDKALNLRSLYLQAVAEVMTCAIPAQKVERMENRSVTSDGQSTLLHIDEVQPSHQKIASNFMKEHSRELFTLLNDHAVGGSHHKLLISVLTILRVLVENSVEIARDVARGIDTHLKDGVLQKIASFSCAKKRRPDTNDDIKREAIALEVQGAFLNLAISLLEYKDNSILSYISSAGMKESKMKAGILYLALRSGLSQGGKIVEKEESLDHRSEDSYQMSLLYLLRLTRLRFCDNIGKEGVVSPQGAKPNFVSKFPLQVYRGDTLEKMIHIYYTKARLPDGESNILDEIKNECKNTFEILVSDVKCSPFLTLLHSKRSTDSHYSVILQQVNKALQYQLAISPTVDTRQFVSACFKSTPALFPSWLRTISFPDPKPSFFCLSMFSLVEFMVKNGPEISIKDSMKSDEDGGKKIYELVVSNIIPRGLTKNVLTKAIQSSNPFMVSQALKLIATMLGRFRSIINATLDSNKNREFLADKIAHRMPDLQIILAIRSKFELTADNSKQQQKFQHHTIVTMDICMILQLYASLFPQAFRTTQFDWTKLLMKSPQILLSMPLSLQHRILGTVSSIHDCFEHLGIRINSLYSVKAYQILSSVLLETKNEIIFKLARKLTISTIENILDSAQLRNLGCSYCIDYEISLWVDGITKDTVEIFCRLLNAVQKVTFQHTTMASSAWIAVYPNEKMPKITFTPLLSFALIGIATKADDFPSKFITVTRDIYAKLLFKQPDSRLLVCLLKSLFDAPQEASGGVETNLSDLYKFAGELIHDEDKNVYKNECAIAAKAFGVKSAHHMVATLASADAKGSSVFKKLIKLLHSSDEVYDVTTAIVSQCIHHLYKRYSHFLYKVLREALPYVIQGGMTAFMRQNILKLPRSSENTSLIQLLSNFFDDDHSSEKVMVRKKISEKVGTYWRGSDSSNESTGISKQVLLLTASISLVLDSETNSSIIGAICRLCSNTRTTSENIRLYLALLVKIIQTFWTDGDTCSSGKQVSAVDIEGVFKLWLLLSSSQYEPASQILPETPLLLSRLESMMSSYITETEKFCVQSAILLKCIQEASIDHVLELSHKHFTSKSSEKNVKSVSSFLEALVLYDVSLFAPNVMRLFDDQNAISENIQKDAIIALMVREISRQTQSSPKLLNWYPDKVNNHLVNSFCSVTQTLIDGNIPHESFEILLEALQIMISQGDLGIEDMTKVYQSLSLLWQRWKALKRKDVPKLTEWLFLSFLSTLSFPSTIEHSDIKQAFQALCNATFSYTAKSLPRAIKTALVHNDSRTVILFLSIVTNILETAEISELTCLQDILVICLKFGLDAVNDEISPKCLEIARLIILSAYEDEDSPRVDKILSPDQVHSMILSHSNFDDLSSSSSRTRTEFISLLLSLASSSPDNTNKDWRQLTKLLIPFRGSISKEDRFLRRLLALHDHSNDSEQDEAFFMHEICSIKPLLPSSQDLIDNAQQWESFIEGLDSKRIRKTIDNFPLNDLVHLEKISHLESSSQDEKGMLDEISSGSESAESSDDSTVESLPSVPPVKSSESKIMEKAYDHEEDDDRYSPGFILPFVLEVLESFAQGAETEEESSPSDTYNGYKKRSYNDSEKTPSHDEDIYYPQRESYAKVSFRLFQKGVLALSITSLSSKCPTLRNIAIAIIYRFKQAIQMKEAKKLATWKSRPQVEMMINSLQRGLVVLRAQKLMKQSAEKEEINPSPPLLPAMNTLFLARALLTLAKPSDDMYGPMNKSFLRLAPHHGAYTDWFSLPAFMTLFCSTNENPDQARKERMWALRLLKDGTVDSHCYRMASRRHVPELLLTSFDAILSKEDISFDEHDECILLLDTIKSLIQRGGSSSFYHYFNAVGILSWVQVILQTVMLKPTTRSTHTAIKFMEVLETILEKAVEQSKVSVADEESPTCPQFDSVKIARGIIAVWEILFDERTNHVNMQRNDVMSQSTPLMCQILFLLYELQDSGDDILHNSFVIHPNGIPIKTSKDLVQTAKKYAPSMVCKIITALCSLPIQAHSLKQDKIAAFMFCQEAIEFILSTKKTPVLEGSVSPSTILKRIADLSPTVLQCADTEDPTDANSPSLLIEKLFGTRRVLVTNYSCSTEWLDCVRVYVNGFIPQQEIDASDALAVDYSDLFAHFEKFNES